MAIPRRTAGLLAAALVAALACPAMAADGGRELRAAAREALRKGDRKTAFDQARKAREVDGDAVESHLLYIEASRGQVAPALLQGEYRARHDAAPDDASTFLLARLLPPGDAEPMLRKFVDGHADAYWCRVGLSSVMARIGRGSDAEALALAALGLRSADAVAAARAGAQCAAAQRYPAAETCYRRAVELDATLRDAHLGLGHALIRLSRLEDATKVLDGVPGASAPDAALLLLRSALATESGDDAAAEAALVKVCAMDAADRDARMQLALVRIRRAVVAGRAAGKPPSGDAISSEMSEMKKIVTELPDRADVQFSYGAALEQVGRLEEAQAAYSEAARLDPLDARPLLAAGAVALARDMLDDAVRELKKAMDREPRDTQAIFLSAIAMDRQGKGKEAADLLGKLLKIDDGNAPAWHALGMVLDGLGKTGDAGSALKKAAELGPGTARFQRDYGEFLYVARKYDQAAAALEKAVALDAADDESWAGLGRCRVAMRKYDRAAEAYEQVATLRPKDPGIRALLGALYHEYLKDFQKALDHYNRFKALGGEIANVDDWIDECEAELEKKKGR